jgi:hypothetical protein
MMGVGECEQLCRVVSDPRGLGSQNPEMLPFAAFRNPQNQRN